MRTVLLLCLSALSFCTPANSRPIQEETNLTNRDYQNNQQMETKINYNFFLIATISDQIKKAIYKDSNGPISQRKRYKDCFSVHDFKNGDLLCLDSNKKPYISADPDYKDCVFLKVKEKNSRDALCPWRTELSPSPQSNNQKKHMHLRHRRSQHVDPSDPLGSENPRTRTINNRKLNREQERERISNVSKETISSCDDPLHVLLSKSPVSPNLQKEKKDKKFGPSEHF